MFSAPGHVFGCTEGVGSIFHVLRSQTRFRRYRVPLCVSGLIFDCSGGVASRFLILRARTHFRRFRGRRIPFSCFARPYSFWRYRGRRVSFSSFARPDSVLAVPRASCPVFLFCAPGLVFDGSRGVGSRFHVLQAQTRFSAVPRASSLVFKLYVPGIVFGCTEGLESRFLILRTRIRFHR
jgi:hypothetical protein